MAHRKLYDTSLLFICSGPVPKAIAHCRLPACLQWTRELRPGNVSAGMADAWRVLNAILVAHRRPSTAMNWTLLLIERARESQAEAITVCAVVVAPPFLYLFGHVASAVHSAVTKSSNSGWTTNKTAMRSFPYSRCALIRLKYTKNGCNLET